MRDVFYWTTLFNDIYKEVSSCHQCQIFEGRRKFLHLPLKPIAVEAPFQQWGLDFISEINHVSLGQHKWILTAKNYFTKWVDVVLTKKATNIVIIEFLFDNIISKFSCPRKIIIANAQDFKSNKMIKFCYDYNIILAHSTVYYPHGNGLAKSSNKSIVIIIKKLLQENKRAWHTKLKFDLWADIIS